MRIWDIDPGFLNDKSLLGEHRELHGLLTIVLHDKKGYAYHPETQRWRQALTGLAVRHDLLVEEMALRGFQHHSPLEPINDATVRWPTNYIDAPHAQYRLLAQKYTHKPQGRIPLPNTPCELWAAHKYSVMARSPQQYKVIGPRVAGNAFLFDDLADHLVNLLRIPPDAGNLRNTCDHLWGYVSSYWDLPILEMGIRQRLRLIQRLAREHAVSYLLHSTALSELLYWSAPANPVYTAASQHTSQ